MSKNKLRDTVWIMITAEGWYPVQPSEKCKPEDHGDLNDHILSIEDIKGRTIWKRSIQ